MWNVMQNISMPKTIHIDWTRYPNFFKLYEKKKNVPKLIYVIGLSKLVYVGNVGSKGGKSGLARRYDEQYVLRAASIFGTKIPKSQPCFTGEFRNPSKISKRDVLNCEKIIQEEFLLNRPKLTPAFKRMGAIVAIRIENHGNKPGFVDEVIEYA